LEFFPKDKLKFHRQFQIKLPVGEVVGNRKLVALNAGNPKVGNGVVDVQQVENFEADPHIVDVPEYIAFHRI